MLTTEIVWVAVVVVAKEGVAVLGGHPAHPIDDFRLPVVVLAVVKMLVSVAWVRHQVHLSPLSFSLAASTG